ncbi:hypothetical protein SFMTTN_0204 [Sulfuriferula multivorans]|uniref:Uncharacterized protein n=1 Tax=Sulfuriferula multivorans TaxID=1559896 RepID=A0A401J9V3_9PROT|nr:hypothetical protein SFMTTN_0204 [Sulfuriferula multivorans]
MPSLHTAVTAPVAGVVAGAGAAKLGLAMSAQRVRSRLVNFIVCAFLLSLQRFGGYINFHACFKKMFATSLLKCTMRSDNACQHAMVDLQVADL